MPSLQPHQQAQANIRPRYPLPSGNGKLDFCACERFGKESAMKRILVVATGGTIASSESSEGLTPTFDADALLGHIPEIKDLCHIEGTTIMNIDSTNMNPSLMKKLAASIYGHINDYDGFVVIHGTDTMAYTSAALVYMLQNIKKPVVVTGSQVAMEALYTDAKKNIANAVRFALEDVNGVFISFDGKIINGTRAVKLKTRSTDAFASVNFPVVANIKLGRITFNKVLNYDGMANILRADPGRPVRLAPQLCEAVMVIKMFPGIQEDYFDYLKGNYKGIVIESFGIGGIPSQEPDIVAKIQELIESGVAVVISTQCLEEGIELDIYEVGVKLSRHPVILAGDMNTEAILMKLMWSLANFDNLEEIKYFMESPVFGDRND
jgi:L-asparaginase